MVWVRAGQFAVDGDRLLGGWQRLVRLSGLGEANDEVVCPVGTLGGVGAVWKFLNNPAGKDHAGPGENDRLVWDRFLDPGQHIERRFGIGAHLGQNLAQDSSCLHGSQGHGNPQAG